MKRKTLDIIILILVIIALILMMVKIATKENSTKKCISNYTNKQEILNKCFN